MRNYEINHKAKIVKILSYQPISIKQIVKEIENYGEAIDDYIIQYFPNIQEFKQLPNTPNNSDPYFKPPPTISM